MGPREPHQKNPQERGLLIIWGERRPTLGASRGTQEIPAREEAERTLDQACPGVMALAALPHLRLHRDLGFTGGSCGQEGLCTAPTHIPVVPLSGSGGPPHNRTMGNLQLDYCRVLYLGLPLKTTWKL